MTKQQLIERNAWSEDKIRIQVEAINALEARLKQQEGYVSISQNEYNSLYALRNDFSELSLINGKLKSELIEMGRTIHEQAKTINTLLSK